MVTLIRDARGNYHAIPVGSKLLPGEERLKTLPAAQAERCLDHYDRRRFLAKLCA